MEFFLNILFEDDANMCWALIMGRFYKLLLILVWLSLMRLSYKDLTPSISVSYTHLDVYKRQALISVTLYLLSAAWRAFSVSEILTFVA